MPDAQFVDVNGARLRYRFDGPESGDVVLLSNSLSTNLHMWDAQVPALTSTGYRVLRYDSRGMGESTATPAPYSIEQLASDAVGLLDALGLDRVHFCGLSKGGMVGQMLGTQHSNRVRSLALCDTAAHMAPASLWDQRIEAARDGGMEAVADGTLERWFTQAGRARLVSEVAAVREMIVSTPVEGFVGCCEAIKAMDQRDSIRTIATPTLVMVGAEDPGTPVAAAELIASRIGGAKLVVLDDAAHLANIEAQAGFDAALLAHLAASS